ncbi:MAG: DNA mismatch repair endonuclease MutL [Planctomycetota bacterium]
MGTETSQNVTDRAGAGAASAAAASAAAASAAAAVRRAIKRLPRRLVDKIAAGEVVERPASVIKELVENAIDAGARRIEVALEGGGARLIRVSDDGHGIPREELRLAVTSHATSKIEEADDLFRILSLGFRGEALASIGAVSHLRLASRPQDEAGAELRVDGGVAGPLRALGLPRGTTVEVGDLFFNVPARREFLRSARGELRALVDEVRRQALCREEIGFRVTHEGKALLEAPATDEPRERIAQLLGRELAEDLLAIPRQEASGVSLRGYASPVDLSRGDSRQQLFFLNRRCVRDVTLLSAVKQAYANLLPPRRHPVVLLWIDLDPAAVDVNVHPQKAEVRFRAEREVFSRVVRGLQDALRAGGLVRELPLGSRHLGSLGGAPLPAAPTAPSLAGLPSVPGSSSLGSSPLGSSSLGSSLGWAPVWASAREPGAEALALPLGEAEAPGLGSGRPFFQLRSRYLIEETESGLRVVDPHALHERILYEEIVARLGSSPLESQRFLFPLVVDAAPLERLALDERAELLRRLGFEVEPYRELGLAIHAAPRLLRAERAATALIDLLGELPARGEDEPTGILHELAAQLACRSAVRFGDALGEPQIAELLARREQVPRGHCCPHGRPTALSLGLDELDRRFGRQGAQRG